MTETQIFQFIMFEDYKNDTEEDSFNPHTTAKDSRLRSECTNRFIHHLNEHMGVPQHLSVNTLAYSNVLPAMAKSVIFITPFGMPDVPTGLNGHPEFSTSTILLELHIDDMVISAQGFRAKISTHCVSRNIIQVKIDYSDAIKDLSTEIRPGYFEINESFKPNSLVKELRENQDSFLFRYNLNLKWAFKPEDDELQTAEMIDAIVDEDPTNELVHSDHIRYQKLIDYFGPGSLYIYIGDE